MTSPTPTPARRFYVSSSIPYVNADPHLGHALELVQADVLARHRRTRHEAVRFQSGTDDNSLSNVAAAERDGVPVADLVGRHGDAFEALRTTLDLSWDDFIRTSRDSRHRPGAERLWRACAAAGDLYRQHYEGRYCVGCERFYPPDELVDGLCPAHRTSPQQVSEENWFFRLSRYSGPLRDLITSGRLRIHPQARANEALALIDSGLLDFSISRAGTRSHGWGVPVPGDPDQVMYVWWDALGNYITTLGYGELGADAPGFRRWWTGADRRVHVIGKDILRFHAVYWPAMLISAGLPLPTDIAVHDFLTVRGDKLSKSLGNVVDPVALAAEYGVDALRWWLLSQVGLLGQTDFSVEGLVGVANRDLAGGFGNLTERVAAMVDRFRGNGLRAAGPGLTPELPDRIDAALSGFDYRGAVRALREAVVEANRYVEETRPWELARAEFGGDPAAGERLDLALARLASTVAELAGELAPLLPGLADRMAGRLRGDRTAAVFPRLG